MPGSTPRAGRSSPRRACPTTWPPARRTVAKRLQEDPIARVVRAFERSLAEDTVRNQYLLHSQVHEWFANGTAPASLEDLNERVYSELFLMPGSDPWLGLVAADAYTALPREATVGVR
jgi:hypothetical protein